jgi:hypothetical protein
VIAQAHPLRWDAQVLSEDRPEQTARGHKTPAIRGEAQLFRAPSLVYGQGAGQKPEVAGRQWAERRAPHMDFVALQC